MPQTKRSSKLFGMLSSNNGSIFVRENLNSSKFVSALDLQQQGCRYTYHIQSRNWTRETRETPEDPEVQSKKTLRDSK